MHYLIDPCPKPRMTQRDKWAKRPAVLRYRAFADECRLRMGPIKLDGCAITFCLPMPASWSVAKKQQHDGAPHRSKPDLSNLIKALEDALYGDDAHIALYARLEKRWAHQGGITITQS